MRSKILNLNYKKANGYDDFIIGKLLKELLEAALRNIIDMYISKKPYLKNWKTT